MTEADFIRYANRTRLRARALRMARAALLDGVSYAEIGRREGVSREYARQAAARILREARLAGQYPRGWVWCAHWMPAEWGEEISKRIAVSRSLMSP